jgi:hypothetical protein
VEINKAYLKNIGKRGKFDGLPNDDQDYTVFDDFERHMIDTNSVVSTNYDANPARNMASIKYFNNNHKTKPNFHLKMNPNRPHQKFPLMENVKNRLTNKNDNNANKIMVDDADHNNIDNNDNMLGNSQNNNNIENRISNKSNSMNDKINNKYDLFHNTKDDGNAFMEDSGISNNDMPTVVGNGNDDDNLQIKYIYSLYKNRYNVNNV